MLLNSADRRVLDQLVLQPDFVMFMVVGIDSALDDE
jgi:hypothetical protein